MQVDRRDLESSLSSKGFKEDRSGEHRYFHHEYNGLRTGVSTYTSHGTRYRTLQDGLIKKVKKQLHLDTNKQLSDLVKCPMTDNDYIAILRQKGKI